MLPETPDSFRFGDVVVQPAQNSVVRDGNEIVLQPRVMDVLVHLAGHRDRVVPTDELLELFWAGRIVEESTIHRLISQLRQALGDSARQPAFIRTVSKRGYQAIAPVVPIDVADSPERQGSGADSANNLTPGVPEAQGGEDSSGAARPGPNQLGRLAVTALLAGATVIVAAGWFAARYATEAGGDPGWQVQSDDATEVLAPIPESIAVLPFTVLSAGETQEAAEAVSGGLADRILDDLASVRHIKVASRTTAWLLAEQGFDIKKIASETGVDYVLEGSVQERAGTVRITAQLIRASDGFHVMSRVYDRKMQEGLEMQDALAKNIAERCHHMIWADLRRQFPGRYPEFRGVDVRAVALYLDAQTAWGNWQIDGEGDPLLAMQLSQKAVEVDPTFREALGDVAWNHVQRTDPNATIEEASAGAHEAINRVLQLNPLDRGILLSQARSHVELDLDYAKAEAIYDRVMAFEPRAYFWRTVMAGVALREGRIDDAILLIDQDNVLSMSQGRSELLPLFATYLRNAGRTERALSVTNEALELIHGGRVHAELLVVKANLLIDLGNPEEAKVQLGKAWKIARHDAPELFAGTLVRLGEPERARRALAAARPTPTNHGLLVLGYQELGDLDAAFAMIRAGIEEHDRSVIGLMRTPRFGSRLRSDPRFNTMMALLESKETPSSLFRREDAGDSG